MNKVFLRLPKMSLLLFMCLDYHCVYYVQPSAPGLLNHRDYSEEKEM